MRTVDLKAASELLDFSKRIDSAQRAEEQLQGAVALHNLLATHRCAYLADEVGMGKTYVALGVLALMQHFKPDLRALVIAPRENIQNKWMKELGNVAEHNVRFADMRVRTLDGRPAMPLVKCDGVLDLVRQSNLHPHGVFFARMTSFSIGLTSQEGAAQSRGARDRVAMRDELKKHLPWLGPEALDLRVREPQEFKDNFARALCCALPRFDLVIVDEAHNLKHGFKPNVAARNRVMALAFGHPDAGANKSTLPGYGRRADRVLFLSATPIEETYTHLWNQLDVFGLGAAFRELLTPGLTDEQRKIVAQRFLIRRVTTMKLGNDKLTKNLYRREWRRGGVETHDEPIRVTDPQQRLVLALVQKKVAELIGNERFGASFQMGMLASFESFQRTAVLTSKAEEADEKSTFDDKEQTAEVRDARVREGVDVRCVNRLARAHRELFQGRELPHPKMDALVSNLSSTWQTGEKALVFVRRIASVTDLKRKLDESYDHWLFDRLHRELPATVEGTLKKVRDRYLAERTELRNAQAREGEPQAGGTGEHEQSDTGGKDTFFAWFFRGDERRGVLSGAVLAERFRSKNSTHATFFEENSAAVLLGCDPAETLPRLSEVLGESEAVVRRGLAERARRFLTTQAKKLMRADLFAAFQGAAVEWLAHHSGPLQEGARIVLHERFGAAPARAPLHGPSLSPQDADWLTTPTFFTELCRPSRTELRGALWPAPSKGDLLSRYRESALRAELLASAARLGHGLIDLYVLTIGQLGSMELGSRGDDDGDDFRGDRDRINRYLDLLDDQRRTPIGLRGWRGFDELAEIARHYELIVDVNLPDARNTALANARKEFGSKLLGTQQPVGGMWGAVNGRLVKQFRMPGYPLVLITTDLLQEGEDLHTFCSRIHHYGISWTPSSMEQRTGRIDRVRSHTERRLLQLECAPAEHKLQVHFPHLEDTVEVLQVRRLLSRMNTFLRLMHDGLHVPRSEENSLNVATEILRHHEPVPAITERLCTAFPVNDQDLRGELTVLARSNADALAIERRFTDLRVALRNDPNVELEPAESGTAGRGRIFGSVQLLGRIQPFGLYLQSFEEHPLVRCVSPIGRVLDEHQLDEALSVHLLPPVRIGALADANDDHSYDLTVEDDVMLASPLHDAERVRQLIFRVTRAADEFERHLLELDQPLSKFRADLDHE